MTQPQVTALIPFFNEAKRLDFFSQSLLEYLDQNIHFGEFIFINDGSTDETEDGLKALVTKANQKTDPSITVRLVNCPQNLGKGGAIKLGVQEATCPWVLMLDADLATSFQQLDEWTQKEGVSFDSTNMAYLGCRELSRRLGLLQYRPSRRLAGRCFQYLVHRLLGLDLEDTQCGFKLFPHKQALEAFEQIQELGYAFDVELLLRLKSLGVGLNALPIKWQDQPHSKVSLWKDSLPMFFALFKMKMHQVGKGDIA